MTSLVEKEVLLKAIYDPSFAKGAFSDLPVGSFTEKEEYKEVFHAIREHYRFKGTSLTERSLLNQIEDRLVRRKANEDKIDKHMDAVHDLYTLKRDPADDDVVDRRIDDFVRGKLVFKAMTDYFESGKGDAGDEESLKKLVPELQKISTMNVSGESGVLVDFFEDVELKKESYKNLETTKFETGFNAIDHISGGGIGREEVGMILGATGSGKCITGDSLITTSKGLLQIHHVPAHYKVDRDTGETQARVASYNTNGEYIPRDTSHWYDMGYSDTIKITTSKGVEIEGTPEHPLLTLTEDGDLEFTELRNMSSGDMITLAKPDMWSDKDLTDVASAYMMGLNSALHETDLDEPEEKLEIPQLVLQSTKEVVLAFIHGVIDIKGELSVKELAIDISDIPYLGKQLQTLFINMGILANRTKRNGYSTLVLTQNQTTELLRILEFSNTDLDILVDDNTRTKEVYKHRLAEEEVQSSIQYGKERYNGKGYDYENRLDDNFMFDSIVKLEPSKAVVYDFTVPETHSFVANGIVSHNTTWAVQQLSNYTKKGLNTLYIALEENLGRLLLKIEQNLLGVSKKDLFDTEGELKEDVFSGAQDIYKNQINLGKLFVSKHLPQEVTVADIEQIVLDIKYRKGVELDAVIIDYPDLMKNTHALGGAQESEAGGKLLEDIRALAGRHKFVCWVLGQLNREGWGQEVRTASSIEGSKRKLNAVEMCFTLNQSDEEFEQGLLRIHIDKLRYSGDSPYSRLQYFKMNREGLRIQDETPEEVESHKALVGAPTDYADKKESNSNKEAIKRINNINAQVGGDN